MQLVNHLLLICIGAVGLGQSAEVPAAAVMKKKVTYTTQVGTVLQKLSQLASYQSMPMGIVIKESELLCKAKAPRSYTETELSKVIGDLLLGSGYRWHLKDGVLEIGPNGEMGQKEMHVLQIKLATFGGINTTIQGLGIVLSGHIRAALFPGEGYAGDILASVDAENVPPFTLRNVSVEEAANSIVSRGSKGLWILYQAAGAHEEVEFRTFSYKDDAKFLRDTPCIVNAQ